MVPIHLRPRSTAGAGCEAQGAEKREWACRKNLKQKGIWLLVFLNPVNPVNPV
ncbi:hypothetical protein SBDP1_850048 [Syntrophobacter sp. SbD1]|nr:hypothetical protein SBDP1_850048 [Syntrophobacter sp. SbD1]